MDHAEIGLRIGELSRRVGVSADVLRAWERRYGVLSPRRSPAGQRLYSAADEQRIRLMRDAIESGYSAQVAARLALDEAPGPLDEGPRSQTEDGGRIAQAPAGRGDLPASLHDLTASLRAALEAYDDTSANAALDHLLAGYGIDTVVRDVVLALLRQIGDRWARNELTVGQEHFASALLIGRLRSLARGWDQGSGPRALVACPAGEAHELGLLCFALLLRQRGMRISYLGASVPPDSIFEAAERLRPDHIVIAAVREEPFWDAFEALSEMSDSFPLAIGGAGASPALGEQLRARVLPADPVAAADAVALD